MAQKSILDSGEAQRRLEQMDEDHSVLLQLISKLKALIQTAEDRTQKVEDRLDAARGTFAEAAATVESFKAALSDLRQEGATAVEELQESSNQMAEETRGRMLQVEQHSVQLEQDARRRQAEWSEEQQAALQDVRQQAATVVGQLQEARNRMAEEISRGMLQIEQRSVQLEQDTRQRQAEWCEEQQAAFQAFRKQHHETLEDLTKAYERQKAVFDSIKTSTESFERQISSLSHGVGREIAKVREDLQRSVASATGSLDSRIEAAAVNAEKRLDGEIQPVRQEQEKLRSEIEDKSRRIRRRILLVWMLLLPSAIVAGYSALKGHDGGPATRKDWRLWTDQTGKYVVEATLDGYTGGTVQLKKLNGKIVSVPIERLSRADQEYVRQSIKGTREE